MKNRGSTSIKDVKLVNILIDGAFYNGHGFAENNRILLKILVDGGYNVSIHARDKEKNIALDQKTINHISTFEKVTLPSNDVYICS